MTDTITLTPLDRIAVDIWKTLGHDPLLLQHPSQGFRVVPAWRCADCGVRLYSWELTDMPEQCPDYEGSRL
jgi:hypothetical protein